MRIDKYLVLNNYFKTRNKAQIAILAKSVKVNGKIIDKTSYDIDGNVDIEIKMINELKYVSRGGLKLEGAIKAFDLDFNNKVVLDIGSSTGGFTDCAIKHGARRVYAVDVGSNQLDESLRNDKRVEEYENTNILNLIKFKEDIDIVLLDCSFVSVINLIEALDFYLNNNNYLILLIKPQFEVGHIKLKNGIVKDKKKHLEVLNKISKNLNDFGLYINEIIKSPIKGGDGNIEFLAKVSKIKLKNIDFMSII